MADRKGNSDVWVIVRCYNEDTVVAPVVRSLREHFSNIVGIDDGSSDNSSAVMADAGAHVVRHSVNLGAGAALQTGLQYALLDRSAALFLCFDADGQHRVEDALSMLEQMRRGGIDVLIGSRFLGAADGMPWSRRSILRLGRFVERLSYGVRLSDTHNGLRLFSRRFAETVELTMSDMAYASELLGLIARSGLPYAEHPVTITYSDYSRAKGQRSINSVNIALDLWLQQLLRGRAR